MNAFGKRIFGITLGLALVGGVCACFNIANKTVMKTDAASLLDTTFTSESWGDKSSKWVSDKNGYQFTTNQGVQVSKSYTGAGAHTKDTFSDIQSITFTYSTNDDSGEGNISVHIGEGIAKTATITKEGGTDDRTTSISFDSTGSGSIYFVINCTASSIFVKSISINGERYVKIQNPPARIDCDEGGTLTTKYENVTNPSFEWSSSDDNVVYVIQEGYDTAYYEAGKYGEATITVTMTCEEGIYTDYCKIIVDNYLVNIQEAIDIAKQLPSGEITPYVVSTSGNICKLGDEGKIDIEDKDGGELGKPTITIADETMTAEIKNYAILDAVLYLKGNLKNNNGAPEFVSISIRNYYDDAENFAEDSNEALDEACKAGVIGVTDELWAERKAQYLEETDENSKEKLKSGTKGYSEDFEKWIVRYEKIVTEGGKEDFMNRKPKSEKDKSIIHNDSTLAITIATVIALVSVSAIGGYFFIKKTKHE